MGVNWSGTAATGYDLLARDVELNLAAAAARASIYAEARSARNRSRVRRDAPVAPEGV